MSLMRGTKASRFFGLPEVQTEEGELSGWRAWKLTRVPKIKSNKEEESLEEYSEEVRDRILNTSWVLKSVSAGVIWEGPVMTTNPLPNGKLAPVSLNNPQRHGKEGRGDYGVYFFKTRKDLIQKLLNAYTLPRPIAVGIVEPFGHGTEVIEHELGYRAQSVVIRHLIVVNPATVPEVKRDLERRYDCEVNFEGSQAWLR